MVLLLSDALDVPLRERNAVAACPETVRVTKSLTWAARARS
jgi:hypothetical protein